MDNKPKWIGVVAHNIRSLHNVGSIFRTADAFGAAKMYLTGYTGTPPDPKIAKVALGAEEFVPWESNKSLVRMIKKIKIDIPDVRIAVLENNVKPPLVTFSLSSYRPAAKTLLILGEETKGNTKKILELADDIVEIPMYGKKESLNVSVACGIALYGLAQND